MKSYECTLAITRFVSMIVCECVKKCFLWMCVWVCMMLWWTVCCLPAQAALPLSAVISLRSGPTQTHQYSDNMDIHISIPIHTFNPSLDN